MGLLSCWLKATLSDALSKVCQVFKKSPSRQKHHSGCRSLIPVKNSPPVTSVSAWWRTLAQGASAITGLDKWHLLHGPLIWVEKPFNTRKWKKLNTSSNTISLGTNWLFARQYSRHWENRNDRKSDKIYFYSSKIQFCGMRNKFSTNTRTWKSEERGDFEGVEAEYGST